MMIVMLGANGGVAFDKERVPFEPLSSYQPGENLQGRLHSVGSNGMDVITFDWIRLFRKFHPELEVTMEARSSLSAAPGLVNGLADVAPVGREFLPSELAIFKAKFGYAPLLVKVATGSFATNYRTHALAVYVHRENPIQELTMAQLDAIFSITRRRGYARSVTTWGDLGLTGAWADRPIRLYAMRRPNGIVNYFQEDVLLGGDFRANIHERTSSSDTSTLSEVVKSIGADSAGIGYAGFAHQTPQVKALALAEEDNGPFVSGSYETVADQSYPLARWAYIAVNRQPGKPLPAAVREFLELALSREGQKIIRDSGEFLPLPPHIVAEELAKIR